MLQLEKVRVPAGRIRTIGPVSLGVPAGSWLGILGPSGAGKTVVAKVIAGLLEPERGHRFLSDPQLDRARILLEGRGIRFVPGHEAFAMQMRVGELLKTRASLRGFHGRTRKRVLDETVQRFHLLDIWRAKLMQLKRSVRRRVALADAFMGKPGLVVLDDPYWGCEDLQIRNIREGILAGERDEVAVAVCSRSPNELLPLVKRVVELGHSGKQLFLGDWRDWKAQRLKPATYRLVAKGRGGTIERTLKKIDGVESVLWHEGGPYNTFEVRADPSPAVREMIFKVMALKSWPIVELTPEPHPYLDDSGYGRELVAGRVKRGKRKRKGPRDQAAKQEEAAAGIHDKSVPHESAQAREAAASQASEATAAVKSATEPRREGGAALQAPADAGAAPTLSGESSPDEAVQPSQPPEAPDEAQRDASSEARAACATSAGGVTDSPPVATDELEEPDAFEDEEEVADEDLGVHEQAAGAPTKSAEMLALKSLLAEADADDAEEAQAALSDARAFDMPGQGEAPPPVPEAQPEKAADVPADGDTTSNGVVASPESPRHDKDFGAATSSPPAQAAPPRSSTPNNDREGTDT